MRKKLRQSTAPLLRLFLLFFLLVSTAAAFSQTVTGTVTDADKNPISKASVQVKGTNRAVLTDNAGKFSIVASANDILVITYVGYISSEVSLNGRQSVNVALTVDTRNMENIVVTALGIKKESKKLGYATTQVNTDELVKNRTANVG